MWYFDEKTLLLTHFLLIERFGGSHGIREPERVRSVLSAPKQSLAGMEQYPDLFEKAAVYAHNIIGDHPFMDGNKRTGITCAVMFMQQNSIEAVFERGELEDYAVKIATERTQIADIAVWLKQHISSNQEGV